MLLDAGPLVALLDRRQPEHEQCAEIILSTSEPLLTCEAVIGEACYLLRRLNKAVKDLLADVADGRYVVEYRLAERADHVAKLMAQYASVPMDLADACLVDMASLHSTGRILTLDSDFAIYRWARNRPFELLLDR